MNLLELFLISFALSIDSFAISVCINSVSKINAWKYASIPLHFVAFHIIMIFIGYKIGLFFQTIIQGFDPWIAFILLTGAGFKIILDSLERKNKKAPDLSTEWKVLIFSIATSIDALIIGLTFSFTLVVLNPSLIMVGVTVFLMSFIGLALGRKLRGLNIQYIDIIAGIILMILGFKILIGHLI